ncbi:hypothetical protein [Paraburkholderia solisilvae]|uniref:hypothetical protein n=1 Tax=Paraburkholderia solisilvae TaxID=624376 RepID=UPI0015821ADA|nr:hypothetical protein [Paraburkholderia solisilvae]
MTDGRRAALDDLTIAPDGPRGEATAGGAAQRSARRLAGKRMIIAWRRAAQTAGRA